MARWFRFTSTTFHVAVNVKAAVYINTKRLKDLHQNILGALCLHPRKTITPDSAAHLEDEDLPAQRRSRPRVEGEGEQPTVTGDEKCHIDYWLKPSANTLAKLQEICTDNSMEHEESHRKRDLAQKLADKHMQQRNEEIERLMEEDIPDDDEHSNGVARVSFLQRMVPHWFMTPFTTLATGAIEQGIANEDQVIRVLKNRVEKLSDGTYTIGDVREFGLLAKRGHLYCTSSPDGVFPLMKRNSEGVSILFSLRIAA